MSYNGDVPLVEHLHLDIDYLVVVVLLLLPVFEFLVDVDFLIFVGFNVYNTMIYNLHS